MAFNPNFTPYQPQTLIVPNANGAGGWRNIGAGLKIAGGYMSWKDKQEQAKRLQDAQDRWYDALTSYLENQRQDNTEFNPETYIQDKKDNDALIASLDDEINTDDNTGNLLRLGKYWKPAYSLIGGV